MRVVGLVCVSFALLLAAGALGGREGGSEGKDLSAPASDVLRNQFTRSCWNDLTLTPSDDELFWRVGGVQEVWCSLRGAHDPSLSSANLTILKDGVPLSHQTVNETSIQVTLNLTLPESYKLICSDDARERVCMSQVYVGYEPLEVEDLQCVSHNWEVFSCNWTLPYNPVQLENEDYVPYLMSLDDPSSKRLCGCNDYNNLLGDRCECPDTCCLWGREDYFPASPKVVVMFVAENNLGSTIFNYTIDNYAVVLPNPMSEVTAAAAAARLEAVVGWTLPAPMSTFAAYAGGVLVRVDHKLTDDGAGGAGAWVQGEVVKCRSTSCRTGQQVVPLEHWWRRYEVRVRLRSAAAPPPVEEDGWWSEWLPRYVNTSAAAPDAPPGVGPGTFQAEAVGFPGLSDLSLAWRAVPPLLHNGSDFRYLAQLCAAPDDDDEFRCTAVLSEMAVTESFAVFQNVSSSEPHTLQVSAHNIAGGGPWAAVWVAAAAARPAPPLLPVVVQHGGAWRQDALYELRWAPGVEGNHTVYLCTGEHQSARLCTGQLYWASVGNTSTVNLTLRDFGLQDASPAQVSFAVSVEDAVGASSGFSWDRCGAPQPYSSVRAPPEPGDPVPSTSAVELPWTLSCSFWAGVVEGVEAIYCRGMHASHENCTEKPMSVTGEPWAGAVSVAGLAAEEEYTAWLRLYYRGGASAWADGRTFTTNTAGVEAWLIVVVACVVVLAAVILVFGLVYGKRKFVDNLKKLRVQPSLPSGLVPTGRQQEPNGSLNGVGGEGKGSDGGGGVGGGGVPVNQTSVSASVKNLVYGQTLPSVVGQSPSLSLNGQEMGTDESLGRGVSQGGEPTHHDHHQQQQQHSRRTTTEDLPDAATEHTTPEEAKVVSSPSSECLISSLSSPDPLLRKTYAPQYVSPYFSESEGEGRDTPTRPLFPGGYVGLAGSGDNGGGRGQGRGGSQSPLTDTWGGDSGGNSGYVSSAACTELPMSPTPTSAGYVTAQHWEHVAGGSSGYVQKDAVPHSLLSPGQSGYVSADFAVVMTDSAPPETTTTDSEASPHGPEDSIPSSASLRGDGHGSEAGKQTGVPSYVSLPDVSWMGDKETVPSEDKLDVEGSKNSEKPSYVSVPDVSWMGDKQTAPGTDKLDIEATKSSEKPNYVSLLDVSWIADKQTIPSADPVNIRGSGGQENAPRTPSNAPAPGYIAVQPPDFGTQTQKANTEERAGRHDLQPAGQYHSPDSLSDLLSKPPNVLHPSPVHLLTPVLPVSAHDAPGVPCQAPKPGIPHWEGDTSGDGCVSLPVTGAHDASEKKNSSRSNSWITSLLSTPRTSLASEESLTGISFVVLGDGPSRNSSVSGGAKVKETNVDSVGEEAGEGEGEEAENEREENDRLSIDGLPKGYSRVGNPPE